MSSTSNRLDAKRIVTAQEMKVRSTPSGSFPMSVVQWVFIEACKRVQSGHTVFGDFKPKSCCGLIPTVSARVSFEVGGVIQPLNETLLELRAVIRFGSTRYSIGYTENISVITSGKRGKTLYLAEGIVPRTHPTIGAFMHLARRWAGEAGLLSDVEEIDDFSDTSGPTMADLIRIAEEQPEKECESVEVSDLLIARSMLAS